MGPTLLILAIAGTLVILADASWRRAWRERRDARRRNRDHPWTR